MILSTLLACAAVLLALAPLAVLIARSPVASVDMMKMILKIRIRIPISWEA
jgi:hypothetical protein